MDPIEAGLSLDAAPLHTWWVVFRPRIDGDPRTWWHWFTGSEMSHCMAFREYIPDFCYIVNPLVHVSEITIMCCSPRKLITAYLTEGWQVLVVQTENPVYSSKPRWFRRSIIMTCAAVVAYTMGVESLAITPRGLWRSLIRRHGAEPLLRNDGAAHDRRIRAQA